MIATTTPEPVASARKARSPSGRAVALMMMLSSLPDPRVRAYGTAQEMVAAAAATCAVSAGGSRAIRVASAAAC